MNQRKLQNELFKALLRKRQEKKLGKNQKILIEAWEMFKKSKGKFRKVI